MEDTLKTPDRVKKAYYHKGSRVSVKNFKGLKLWRTWKNIENIDFRKFSCINMLCTTWPPIPHTYNRLFKRAILTTYTFIRCRGSSYILSTLRSRLMFGQPVTLCTTMQKYGFGHRRGTNIAVNTDNFAVNSPYFGRGKLRKLLKCCCNMVMRPCFCTMICAVYFVEVGQKIVWEQKSIIGERIVSTFVEQMSLAEGKLMV